MRILLSAYACAPHQGSEPGVGWGWLMQWLMLGHEVHLLTRRNNLAAIRAALPASAALHLHGVDLPERWLGWKRGEWGVRLYYGLWQRLALRQARILCREVTFDLIHHATLASCWRAAPLAALPVPMIWGPAGGGETPPVSFWPGLGVRGGLWEAARWLGRGAASRLGGATATARGCRLAVAANADSAGLMHRLGAARVVRLSQVSLPLTPRPTRQSEEALLFLYAGDLLPHKGVHLALHALALARITQPWRFEVYGSGPEGVRLQRLTTELGLGGRVLFPGRIPRPALRQRLAEASILLFPALHDSGGMVCIEAMASATPVICLALGGPAELIPATGGTVVTADHPRATIARLAAVITRLAADPAERQRVGLLGRQRVEERYFWPRPALILLQAWEENAP